VNGVLDAGFDHGQSHAMARLTIRIDLGGDAAFGPGKARLLELVAEKGSIRGAALAMGMSYRRAWLLLRDVEAAMGAAAIAAETGGARGGGSSLTPLGRAVLDQYRAIEKQAARSVAAQLRALSKLADAPSGPLPRRRKKTPPRTRKSSAGKC
jgi:molybdate transport system regulatory protein